MPGKPKRDDADLLYRIRGLYRLLDLIDEQGSGGAVDKVTIAQESVAKFVNDICPGAYTSMTKIDFNALDSRDIKPIGIYGSISAIVDFLRKVGCIDEETASLLLAPAGSVGAAQRPILRPGLYLLQSSNLQPNLVYIIFWPEETTWDDRAAGAVSRNRTAFMRFLTKLCDQVVALISDQHSEKLVFKGDTDHVDSIDGSDRLFYFEVQQTGQEEESASASEGFKFSHICAAEVTKGPKGFDLKRLQPILVASDTAQAILSAEYIPEQSRKEPIGFVYRVGLSDILKTSRSPRLILDESIDFSSLKILLQRGLNQRCSIGYQSWRAERTRDDQLMKQRENDAIGAGRIQQSEAFHRIMDGITRWLTEQAVAQYPSLKEEVVIANILEGSSEQGILPDDLRYLQTVEVLGLLTRNLRQVNNDPKSRFYTLKKRFCQHHELLQMEKGFRNETVQRMINILGTHGDYKKEIVQILQDSRDQFRSDQPDAWSIFIGGLTSRASEAILDGSKLAQKDDTTFLKEICTMVEQEPAYRQIAKEILQEAAESLSIKLKESKRELLLLVDQAIARISRQEIDERINAEKRDADQAAQARLCSLIRATLDAESDHPTNRNRVIIRGVSLNKSNYQEIFHVDGETIVPLEAGICFKFNILDVKRQDTIESDYIPQPFIRRTPPPNFTLPSSHDIRFIRLIGSERCLLVVQDPQGDLNVYLDTLYGLGNAVEAGPKKIFYSSKLGSNPLFALDEAKRILVIYASDENHAQIIPYIYEAVSNTLNARGGVINITRWFDGQSIPRILHATLTSGSEELLMVDETGLARIFSLETEQFRPAVYMLDYIPASICTVPDGAAFLALESRSNEPRRLLCYYLAWSGAVAAIPIKLPEEIQLSANMVVSRVGKTEKPHVISLDPFARVCSSVSLHITSKTSEYDFRAAGNRSDFVEKNTVHNSLIDCHSDVWTRYPFQAAICRETAPDSLSKYFKALVRNFGQMSRKPTSQLSKINTAVHSSFDPTSPNLLISQFKAGDWLVGLFCLIPIHIAVTGQNRFIPLRDGVISQEFEQSLLGADVGRIAEALSIGWYESIFTSYLARKPVRVVTSMGEQSVGKSYALNHFVDTSFAVSAMRSTEGVWLSVTPTQDALVVSMDFEGVNSIARSAQEDTLLVLFNVAISNLVLFRNNFALSRDIASPFKSFQSSSRVLDPVANPTLFQSALAIIIKDVIDSDTEEIVNEFALEFQQMVQHEAGDNFISRLHRGKLAIIPWPVIQSTKFYYLFGALKTQFEKQPITHKSAGEFIRVLKMLMAKLKVCDWSAIDQNLAAQRVQNLISYIATALAFGCLDPETRSEPLKNMDTGEIIPGPSSAIVFYLSNIEAPITAEACLASLLLNWEGRHNRFKILEDEFLTAFNRHLLSIADARIGQVRTWLEENTARFAQHADVQRLFRIFDESVKELKSHVALCGVACASCSLSCLKDSQHDDAHECYTTHKSPHAYEFDVRHDGLLSTESEWDRNSLNQANVSEIIDKFAAQGSEGAQKLAQEVNTSFNLYSDVSEKARLLDLVDGLVLHCDNAFHRQLAEDGFFQTLISDEKVQSDQKFRTDVQAHLAIWLGSLSGKASEIASDVLQLLSGTSKGESLTNRQPGSSNRGGPLDQLLYRGSREVITFQTPKLEKQLFKFLLSSYIQAGDILLKSRRVKWFSLQAIHIARQAFHLIIRFNDFIGPDGPTNEQYDEGMDLDDALEELEDKIDALEKLELDEAIRCEEDHKYDLARLYQIFFTTRDFYPNGRDYQTDPVLKRLAGSDHTTLILARRVEVGDSHTEDPKSLEVPVMTSRQEKSATQMLNEISVGGVIYQGPFPGPSHTDNAPTWACNVYVNGQLLGSSYDHKNKKDAKEMAAMKAAESLGLM